MHLVVEIQAMIYDVARVRRLCTKFEVNTSKNKNFRLGGHFLGALTDTRNGLKNPNMNFGNDRSHRLGRV